MADFRLDRQRFKAHSATEASDYAAYYKSLDWKERMKIAAYLNSEAYRYDPQHPPVMDRTAFKARSRNHDGKHI
jgi:hypothetical protein